MVFIPEVWGVSLHRPVRGYAARRPYGEPLADTRAVLRTARLNRLPQEASASLSIKVREYGG
jgi:hypothetical protein